MIEILRGNAVALLCPNNCMCLRVRERSKILMYHKKETTIGLFGWIWSVCVLAYVRIWERISVLDEACNSICHVFMGGPFLSSLGSTIFWLPFVDKWIISHTRISPEYLLYLQKEKKGNPIKKTQRANKAYSPKHISFCLKNVFLSRLQIFLR